MILTYRRTDGYVQDGSSLMAKLQRLAAISYGSHLEAVQLINIIYELDLSIFNMTFLNMNLYADF